MAGGGGGGGLEGHVLVATLPGKPPDVHIATLDTSQGVLRLQEASVLQGGEVSLGAETSVRMSAVSSVDNSHGAVTLFSNTSGVLAQLHPETPEDQKAWLAGLRAAAAASALRGAAGVTAANKTGGAVANAAAAGGDQGEDGEVAALRAQSRELQERIHSLENVGQRREKQLNKLLRRLDGAMGMLAAVQDMVGQQRKVIVTQKAAIVELQRECGVEDSDEAAPAAAPATAAAANASATFVPRIPAGAASPPSRSPVHPSTGGSGGGSGGNSAEAQALAQAEAEIESKTAQMEALLKQAEDMQKALEDLEAMESAAASGAVSPAAATAATAAAAALAAAMPGSPSPSRGTAAQPNDEAEALADRMRELEAEKSRLQEMLAGAAAASAGGSPGLRQDHREWLQRLE